MNYLGNLIFIQTTNPAIIFNDTVEYFCSKTFSAKTPSSINKIVKGFNLYVTIDKKIEIGQPYFTSDCRVVFWNEEQKRQAKNVLLNYKTPHPIILSTDVNLIENKHIPFIDINYVKSFVEKINDSGVPPDFINLYQPDTKKGFYEIEYPDSDSEIVEKGCPFDEPINYSFIETKNNQIKESKDLVIFIERMKKHFFINYFRKEIIKAHRKGFRDSSKGISIRKSIEDFKQHNSFFNE